MDDLSYTDKKTQKELIGRRAKDARMILNPEIGKDIYQFVTNLNISRETQ